MNTFDPFARCEVKCNHDLARGVTLEELLSVDEPHDEPHLVIRLPARPVEAHERRAQSR